MMLKGILTEKPEAGCDEAGRGCLAGPVCAAAVILPDDYDNPMLNDSKKLSEKQRNLLRTDIEAKALAYGVAFVEHDEIDRVNILRASIMAMHKALNQLHIVPEHILVDGNRFYPFNNIPHTCVVGGDGKYVAIAAASILAKTYRDELMLKLDKQFPQYLWHKNKGYPTQEHRRAIQKYGPSEHHRLTFNLLDRQIKLNI
jgi:ribonuclease HII